MALTRFRVGAHALAVEVGRYHKPSPLPLGQRLCVFCNMVEDELHFLCICHKYNTLRKQLNEDIVRQFPEYRYLTTEQKFIFLMQTPHPYIHSTLSLLNLYIMHLKYVHVMTNTTLALWSLKLLLLLYTWCVCVCVCVCAFYSPTTHYLPYNKICFYAFSLT